MNDQSVENQIGERLAVLETSLRQHIFACTRTNNRIFAVLLMVAGGVGTVLIRVIWFLQ